MPSEPHLVGEVFVLCNGADPFMCVHMFLQWDHSN